MSGVSDVFEAVTWIAVLVVVLGAGIVAAAVAVRWYRRAQSPPADAGTLLSQFRDLRDRGAISDEEYRNIKTQLGLKLRDEIADASAPGSPKTSRRRKGRR